MRRTVLVTVVILVVVECRCRRIAVTSGSHLLCYETPGRRRGRSSLPRLRPFLLVVVAAALHVLSALPSSFPSSLLSLVVAVAVLRGRRRLVLLGRTTYLTINKYSLLVLSSF